MEEGEVELEFVVLLRTVASRGAGVRALDASGQHQDTGYLEVCKDRKGGN